MSDFPGNLDPKRNLASTYQEVLKIKKYIDEDLGPFITLIKNAFGDGKFDIGKGDVVIDPDGNAKVPGITVVVNNTYIQQGPADYDRDITFEIKDKDVIDLPQTDTTPGVVNNRYVTVMTTHIHQTIMNPDGSTSDSYPAWQIAYGDENGRLYLYYRKSVGDDEWGPWNKVFDLEVMLELNPEVVEKFSHRQIVENDVLPTGQEIGDYWFWPIQKGVDPVADGSGIIDITDIEWPDIPDGYFFQSLDDSKKYLLPDVNCRYVYVDIATGSMILPKPGEKDVMPGADDPDPGYIGYYTVNLDNFSDKIYFDDDEMLRWHLYIVGALQMDKNGKPIDPLDTDNNGIYTGTDFLYRPDVTDGGGDGVPDPDKGTADHTYPYDPDGQKPGDEVDQKIAQEIIIIDLGTGKEIDPILSKTKGWWLLDPSDSKNDAELVANEYKRYSLFVLPGGTEIDAVKFKDTALQEP